MHGLCSLRPPYRSSRALAPYSSFSRDLEQRGALLTGLSWPKELASGRPHPGTAPGNVPLSPSLCFLFPEWVGGLFYCLGG